MAKRYQDKDYLKWVVRTKPCMICKAGFLTHGGPIQAHHLLKPKSKLRGFGLRANDDEVIPLCMYHHQKLHTKFGDEHKFLKNYVFKDDAEIKYAEEIYQQYQYENSDDYKDDLPF